jgi:hypothetical protein
MGHSDQHSPIRRCSSCGSTQHAVCPPCETHTPLRNHYFFGKLMDVPDFDVEQAYVVEKFMRHHARLHGTGVVCGLEVGQHPKPACRDRYLVVQPGSALDCCGNEILVLDEETIDLQSFAAVKALAAAPDPNGAVPPPADPVLQLCLRYRECPTEEVPVLYDECGCDDTRCAPNRILETYDFDVLVNPALPTPAIPNAPSLAWRSTIALAGAQAAATHRTTLRLYAAADVQPSGGLIQQYQLATLAPLAPRPFTTRVLAIALDVDGKRLFAAVAGATTADAAQLHTLDTTSASAFSTGATSPVDIPASAGALSVQLAVGAAGLVSIAVTTGANPSALQVWDTTTSPPSAIAAKSAAAPIALVGAVFGNDGRLYAAAPTASVQSFDPSVSGLDPKSVAISSTDVAGLAIAKSTGPDRLVWLERAGRQLTQSQLDGSAPKSIAFADTPVALVLDASGQTAFVLTQGAAGEQVCSVDLHRLAAGQTPVLGPAQAIGANASAASTGIGRALLALDDQLFASYLDGVAVLTVDATDCGATLGPHACPQCSSPDCVVLATIVGYHPGYMLEDVSVPPSDPMADSAAKIARIDNRLGRMVVPSVSDLAAAVACLLERAPGGAGPQGPPGQDGKPGLPGPGIDSVTADFVPCDQPGSATLAAGTLNLVIPRGCDGVDGQDGLAGGGLDWDLPHICGFNWPHGATMALPPGGPLSLIVAFDTNIVATDLNTLSIHVQVRTPDERFGNQLLCWCDLNLDDDSGIVAGQLAASCDVKSKFTPGAVGGMANAVLIRPRTLNRIVDGIDGPVWLRVFINGDFVRGVHHKSGELRALDADHLPKLSPPSPPFAPQPGTAPEWLQPGDKRFTGDGIEGGLFESIFRVR